MRQLKHTNTLTMVLLMMILFNFQLSFHNQSTISCQLFMAYPYCEKNCQNWPIYWKDKVVCIFCSCLDDNTSVVPHASSHYFPFGNYDSHIWVITMHAEPLRKSIHFLHQYTSPFAMLTSVLFYKEGLYISMQHHSKHWRGSPFTGLPHHHLVRLGVNTSILILIVSILL
jgi:hypothetical protein